MKTTKTDNKTIKAIKCCSCIYDAMSCENCPYDGDDLFRPCSCNLLIDTIDLINRRDAVIERLNKEVDRLSQCVLYHEGHISDAIKEFEERAIKNICEKVIAPTPTQSFVVEKCIQVIVETAKEMGGDTE